MHVISTRVTRLYQMHNNLSVHLTTITEVQPSEWIVDGMRKGSRALRASVLSSTTLPAGLARQEQRAGSGSNATAAVSDVSAPVCTHERWTRAGAGEPRFSL